MKVTITHEDMRRIAARDRREASVEMMRDGRRNRSAQFADRRDKVNARNPKHRQGGGRHWQEE